MVLPAYLHQPRRCDRLRLMDTSTQPAAGPTRRIWRPGRRQVIVAAVVACVVALVVFSVYRWHTADKVTISLPSDITTLAVSFPVYYPSPLPEGYMYEQGSASLQDGVLFYKLHNNMQEMLITEQVAPTNNLLLDSIVGFNGIHTANGTAYVGKNGAQPTAIIRTKSTLINISATPDVSSDLVNATVEALVAAH